MQAVIGKKGSGEERDDVPPPNKIHIEPFSENGKEFFVFGVHVQRAALVCLSHSLVDH